MYYMEFNPFEPDRPAKPSIFAGRKAEIKQITTALYRTYQGRGQNLLLEGEKGIGKTSLADYTVHLAQTADLVFDVPHLRFLTIFASLGSCRNVDEVCVKILNEANNKIREATPSFYDSFKEFLGRIEGVTLGGFGLQLKDTSGQSSVVVPHFARMLEELWQRVEKEYQAILIVLDETEIIASQPAFAPFLKSLIEELSRNNCERIMFLVCATPEAIDKLNESHPSFSRVFTSIRIKHLNEDETAELVTKVLEEGNPRVTASNAFMKHIYGFSSGIPSFIHELGKAAFEVNSDEVLNGEDLVLGLMGTDKVKGALAALEDKHFRRRYTKTILSNTYRDILHIIASFEDDIVTFADIRQKFAGKPTSLGGYMKNMVKRGVIEKVEGRRGAYRLPDRMFKLFLLLEAKKRK